MIPSILQSTSKEDEGFGMATTGPSLNIIENLWRDLKHAIHARYTLEYPKDQFWVICSFLLSQENLSS